MKTQHTENIKIISSKKEKQPFTALFLRIQLHERGLAPIFISYKSQ